ncbi:MAG TPA: cell surface protein SprA, partial [Microscillaceae bacterium]|nr:cell surface protein SprA [Microscillaceae bacterium]
YVRAIIPQEIFQNRQRLQLNTNEIIFDLAYYPSERGPYNYTTNLDPNGNLLNPSQNFGAITRAFTSDVDFDNANIEYVEFWMLDPFIASPNGRVLDGQFNVNNTTGGTLFLNLGSISEDVVRNNRQDFENGLPPGGADPSNTNTSPWGLTTRQQFVTNAFDNSGGARTNQDVGWDGLRNDLEGSYFTDYINTLPLSLTPDARARILADPSADNFSYYLGSDKDAANQKVLERYKNYNGLEGNSPISSGTAAFAAAATNLPDNEDLNNDNTLNQVEGYYQYRIDLRPGQLQVGQNYVVDRVQASVNSNNENVNWYLFRVPVREFTEQIGSINGFKTIRFMRMFMTNFQQPVVLRFAQFQMVSNTWRRYLNDLTDRTFNQPLEPYDPNFTVTTVSIEENGQGGPNRTAYVLPPGVIRDRDVTNINNRQINEQSISMCVTDLRDRDARAVFKNTNFDFLMHKNLNMYIHAESPDNSARDGEVTAFVRLGTDFNENYYEIEVPLIMTPLGTPRTSPEIIWPTDNQINIAFKELVDTKIERNSNPATRILTIPYFRQSGRYRITVVGNPDLSSVQVVMLGVRNPNTGQTDDRLPKSVCVWMNELRATGFDCTNGWSALARLNVKFADFAQVTSSFQYTTFGFGTLNQKISERTRNNTLLFDIQANIALDKFFPERWKLKIPMFVSYEYRNVQPRFNPLDPDVPLQSLYSRLSDPERRTLQGVVEEFVIRRSINFANVRKEQSNPQGKKYFFDLSNFAFNFAYNEEIRSNYLTSSYVFKAWRASVVYNYTRESKPFEPFRKLGFLQSPWFALIRDLNFNFLPNSILIKADLDRTFGRTSLRGPDLGGTAPLFEKIFRFNRFYDLQWNITKSLGLNYNANANALVDEPFGDLDTQEKRDSVMNNLMRLGRMKLFTQQVGANYKLPFDKFPLTDFISGNATYSASYNWQAGAIGIADTMGNQIRNSRDRGLNGRVDLVKLYKKLKFLNMIETPPIKEKLPPEADTLKKKFNANNLLRAIIRPFLALRSINFTYTVQEQTTLPGFRPIPRFVGLDSAFAAPGWDFIFGGQDPDIRYRAADNGWLARSRFVNTPFSQNLQENLSIRALIEPIPDLRITVEFQRRQTAGYQEIFRFNPATGQHESQNPLRTGTYSVSFLSIFSAFTARDDGLNQSPVFQTFQNYREIIRQRLAAQNPNAGEYGLNSQDVLIPAFLAAYGGQNPNSVSLASFPEIPLPNWRLDYNGLNKLPFFKDIFATFNVTHSYSSLYTVGSFTSSLEYGTQFVNVNQNIFRYIPPSIVNAQNQFVSVNVVNGVSITERFAPLIGLDIKTRSNFTLRFDMNRERNLNLNLSNAQMAELRSEDFIIGIGYTKKNMRIPFFKSKGKPIILKNDFTFRLDFAIRETRTVQRKLDDVQTVTAGNQNIQIKPVISYVASNRLNLQLFYEFTLNTPRISSSFPRSNSVFGIQLRYNLTD